MNDAALHIKNMVCDRCIMVVQSELEKLGFHPESITLGEVVLREKANDTEKAEIDAHLQQFGFELIDDKKQRIVEKVKNSIVKLVHHQQELLTTNLSDYISSQLHLDYNYISNIFSETEGSTIEKYFISQKIERVKELLSYDEYSLSEIADQLQYSSVAHLSNQFKKQTGLTPTEFKRQTEKSRKTLDKI